MRLCLEFRLEALGDVAGVRWSVWRGVGHFALFLLPLTFHFGFLAYFRSLQPTTAWTPLETVCLSESVATLQVSGTPFRHWFTLSKFNWWAHSRKNWEGWEQYQFDGRNVTVKKEGVVLWYQFGIMKANAKRGSWVCPITKPIVKTIPQRWGVRRVGSIRNKYIYCVKWQVKINYHLIWIVN